MYTPITEVDEELQIKVKVKTFEISNEELQNLSVMKDELGSHLKEYYNVNSDNIVNVQIMSEETFAPRLIIKERY